MTRIRWRSCELHLRFRLEGLEAGASKVAAQQLLELQSRVPSAAPDGLGPAADRRHGEHPRRDRSQQLPNLSQALLRLCKNEKVLDSRIVMVGVSIRTHHNRKGDDRAESCAAYQVEQLAYGAPGQLLQSFENPQLRQGVHSKAIKRQNACPGSRRTGSERHGARKRGPQHGDVVRVQEEGRHLQSTASL